MASSSHSLHTSYNDFAFVHLMLYPSGTSAGGSGEEEAGDGGGVCCRRTDNFQRVSRESWQPFVARAVEEIVGKDQVMPSIQPASPTDIDLCVSDSRFVRVMCV
jgi:hypothetical protein